MKTHITIKNRPMEFIQSGNTYKLPTLQKTTKQSKIIKWDISVSPHEEFYAITTDSYYINGEHKISAPTVIKGKNTGRKNETSSREQALFQAYSLWLKKKDQNYKENEEKIETLGIMPMLANKYLNMGLKYLTEPFAVSPKIDGIRAVATIENGTVVLRTRNGNIVVFLDTVKEHLKRICPFFRDWRDVVLDGELYSHDLTFNEILGTVRASKTKSSKDSDIQFWIFDVLNLKQPEQTYRERIEVLRNLQIHYEATLNFTEYTRCIHSLVKERKLMFVDYIRCTHARAEQMHNQYVSLGFEGLIARELNSIYEFGTRSNYLLKYKYFNDSEFIIIDTKCGTGGADGAIIFICETHQHHTFSVYPRGTIEYKRQLYQDREKLIGKQLTVRYQSSDPETGVPRFPIGISVRDYE